MPPPDLSRRGFIGASAALGGLIALHPFSARAQAGQAHLRILSTTDLHCHVQPYDYYADKPTDTVGLSRTASVIEAIRAEATNTLLVDNGDYLQGNPMGDYIAYERGMQPGDLHPVIAGMNTLAYEAGTLGNHEFNYGVEFLDLVNAGAAFPIVCANFARTLGPAPRDDALHLEPYVLLDRTLIDGAGTPRAIRVGLIGFVPPQIMLWDRGHLEGRFAVRDILEAARAWVPEMREAGRRRRRRAQPFRHRAGAGRGDDRERRLPARRRRGDRRRRHRPPAPGLAGRGLRRRRARPGDRRDPRQAGGDGRLLGLAHGPDRPPARARRRRLAGGGLRGERAADLPAQRGPQRRPRWSATTRRRSRRRPRCTRRRSTTCAPRSGSRRRRCSPISRWSPTTPRCRSSARRRPGTSTELLKGTEWEGLPVLSAAAPFKSGGRGGPDYYTDVAGRADRDQERRRRLPLPEHAAGGGDHRRAGQGLARAVGGHLPAGRAGQGRPAADRPGVPRLQFRRDRRRDLRDRRDPALALRRRGRAR